MKGNKSSISKANSYKEIGEFWDAHDLTDFWEQTEEHGVSTVTLRNLWIERNVAEEMAVRK